jgi:nitric oxide reductase large subunit
MASIAMMVVGAVVNAIAFTGGNALFSMIDKSGAQQESKRHNAAIEKLNKEQTDYNIKRAKNQDWLSAQISRKQEATNEIYSVNSAFDKYKQLFGKDPEPELPHPNLEAPQFDYIPSEEQKKYENMFTGAATLAGVGGAIATFK